MSEKLPLLAWIDIETTGLNPVENHVLEIAMRLTDEDLEPIGSDLHLIHSLAGISFDSFAPSVIEMHSKNGLIADCAARGLPRERFTQLLGSWIGAAREESSGSLLLAGSSVHFDRGFLFSNWPGLEKHFSHRNLDVSSIKEMFKRWSPETVSASPADSKPHRAKEDMLASIDELKVYLGAMR